MGLRETFYSQITISLCGIITPFGFTDRRCWGTGTFREQLAKKLGSDATPELVNTLFNTLATASIPVWGSEQRNAINAAYNNVTSFFYIAAIVIIVPAFVLVWFLPNQTLTYVLYFS